MWVVLKRKPAHSSRFSDFIRTASASEKKRVYTKVMKRASELQNAVLRRDARSSKEQ